MALTGHRYGGRLPVAALAAALLGLAPLAVPGAAAPPCTGSTPGGEWTSYGQDAMGQQRQRAEKLLTRTTVAGLTPAWTATGSMVQSAPPIVAGGCAFANIDGHVQALDLRTGRVVWRNDEVSTAGTYGVAAVDGRIHVHTNVGQQPRAVALDQRTGKVLWQSAPISFGYPANQYSSPVVHKGVHLLFTTGPDNDPQARQGYGLIDAKTGKVLYKGMTLPKADQDAGLVGGGAWSTPTVDPRTGHAYVGTSNPESKRGESRYDNALLKLDIDRSRGTFGKVVATYKGTPDSVTGYDNPACRTVGGDAYVNLGVYGGSPSCGQIDVDFGVAPTLWRDPRGRTLGAATQKSGYLHVIDTATMKPVWTRFLFPTLSFGGGNIVRSATDGRTLYVGFNPGVLYAFDAATGRELWRTAPHAGAPMKGGNIALVDGVLFYNNDDRARAYDTRTGAVLWEGPITPSASTGSSVVVAGHRLLVNHGGTLTAYRLPR